MKAASREVALLVVVFAISLIGYLAFKNHEMKATRRNLLTCEAAAESDHEAQITLYVYQYTNSFLADEDAKHSAEFIDFLYDKANNECEHEYQ